METAEPRTLDDGLWDRLSELTEGAADLCYQCGVCTAICPWGLVREEPLPVRTLVRHAQLGLSDAQDALWLCTACAQCEVTCPRQVPVVTVIRALRQLRWERRQTLKGLPSVLWSLYWNNNPWSQPPSRRGNWAQGLELPTYDAEKHEVLLYVGCTCSYDRRAQSIAGALVKVLRAADVRFGVLGEGEPCCGEPALSLGHLPYFEEIAQKTAEVFRERGVRRLVAISPHAFDVFQNHYPALDEGFRPSHYVQYLADLVRTGRLGFDRSLDLALCCGGGGGRAWIETPAGERFSDLRIREAAATGASVIATACPLCVACLEDSLRAQPLAGMQVLDVAEIAARALGETA
ncbi:MAG: (Fe-S)-binding protein [Chloroflexi bacterium]|nr:(Fe-S)-binding protein [Chloroflexota bacterium]